MQSLAVVLTLALAQAGAEPTPTPTEPAASETAAPAAESTATVATGAPATSAEPPKPNEFHAAVPVQPAPAHDEHATKFVDLSGTRPTGALSLVSSKPWWQRVAISGFARVGLFYTFPFRDEQLVGGNGGFRLADFRLNAEFKPVDKLTVYASVELAAPLANANDPLTGTRIVALRDAWVQYEVAPALVIRAGQYRPPYYAEMLMSTGSMPFVNRSVLGDGVAPPEAYGTRALALDRQIGVQLSSKRLGKDFGFRYYAGVFNGNGPNVLFNSNNSPMPVGRVELDFQQHLTLGLNAFYAVRAEGTRPTRLYTNQLGYGADLEAKFGGFSAMAAFLGRSSTFNYAGLAPESGMGALGQVRYFHDATGLEAAVRFAWYEPSSAQLDDQLTELAAMVAWRPFELPFRVLVQYTHRGEESQVSYPNDSVDLLLHAVW